MSKENKFEKVIQFLKDNRDEDRIKGMKKVGITPEKAFGVSIPNLRKIAKDTNRNHDLAMQLWEMDTRETRILACMIDDPKTLTEEQMEQWVKEFDYWEICDQCIMNLFEKSPFAIKKAKEWVERKDEYTKRAGFVLMARLAVSDKNAKDELFESFLKYIIQYADDERQIVKKAISWALRQIGKRNKALNKMAIKKATDLIESNSKNKIWIGKDALRDITREKVLEKLK